MRGASQAPVLLLAKRAGQAQSDCWHVFIHPFPFLSRAGAGGLLVLVPQKLSTHMAFLRGNSMQALFLARPLKKLLLRGGAMAATSCNNSSRLPWACAFFC
jgi:hypothetical protein